MCQDLALFGTSRRTFCNGLVNKQNTFYGSDCGSVGRAVASDLEVRGSNPVIGKILYCTFTVNCIVKTKIKKKRPGIAHFLKKQDFYQLLHGRTK